MTENATVSHSHTHALEATGLKKHYGPRNVVKGVSLAVKSGEVVGLLGKNGAGKTTTFYMVVGLVVADDGQIRLDGQDITHMPIYKRARMGLSYLPQEASVFRKLSVEDNVRAILELQDCRSGQRVRVRQRGHHPRRKAAAGSDEAVLGRFGSKPAKCS